MSAYSLKKKVKQLVKNNAVLLAIYNQYRDISYARMRRNIQKHGFDVLKHIHAVLEREALVFFLDFGTLLGVVREGRLIEHDLDLDIGVIEKGDNTRNIVTHALTENGCILKYEYCYHDRVVQQSFLYKGVKFDVCYYRENTKSLVCYLFYRIPEIDYLDNEMSVVRMTYDRIEGVEEYRVGGYVFYVPSGAEKFLEQKYGETWNIPDAKWVYWEAPTANKCEDLGIQKIRV